MKLKGYERGSMLDLALIMGGSPDCIISLCLNLGVSLTDEMEIGREYDSNSVEPTNTLYLKVIEDENIRPATALSEDDLTVCPYGGIGLMGIEIDFIVS